MSCLDVIRCVCTAARILVSQGPPPLDTPSQPADTIISQGPPPADIQGPPSDILLSQPPLPSDASNAAHEAEGAGGSSAARTAPAILAGEGSGAAGRPMLGNGEGDAPLLEVQNGPQRPGAVEGGGVGEERRAGAGGQGDGHGGGEGGGQGGGEWGGAQGDGHGGEVEREGDGWAPQADRLLEGVVHQMLDPQSARQWAWAFRALDLYQTLIIVWANARGIPVLPSELQKCQN